jgi:hypothetical protein
LAPAAFFCQELFGVALISFFLRILPLLPLLTSVQGSSLPTPRERVFCDFAVSRAEQLLTLLQSDTRYWELTQGSAKPRPWAKLSYAYGVNDNASHHPAESQSIEYSFPAIVPPFDRIQDNRLQWDGGGSTTTRTMPKFRKLGSMDHICCLLLAIGYWLFVMRFARF